ncbi:redoxin family protein [Polaribacter batillariae]|uniref:Redoxin family protein n=1 Tax=Polaribacter batillariae TaxID=2808900 RepID=A0ABX7SX64_9FLAO|nr:TlpA family protein disulfide reductase [Polaribacter batillariae]QTD37438.1 redoxin family protein [Polaribacter batillariae]
MKKILLIFIILVSSCTFEKPTEFSELALKEKAYTVSNEQISIQEILNKYKGKKILIDVWASWCGDCIKGLRSVKNLQKQYPEVVFLFLSVDKNKRAWKNGIAKFGITGEHYNLPKGMKDGDFVDFLNLSWIPRYLVISEQGKIKLFKATKASDANIVEALK